MSGNSGVLLEINGISKKYCKDARASRRHLVKQLLISFAPNRFNTEMLRKGEFWALQNLSLSFKRGEVVGIIGPNGSGKSTLMKLVNGLILPDRGSLNIYGDVGGLIELGAGFQPELTGRENIFIKGALIGKSKSELDLLFDSIVEFGELAEFIDLPIKNYSSGMQARLGFSISVHQNPDILLMDEVLAVGDFNFQQKCLAKVNEMRSQKCILLVSHSMNSIRMFCDRVIVLENGRQIFDGPPQQAISFYMEREKGGGSGNKPMSGNSNKGVYGDLFINEKKISNVHITWSNDAYHHGGEMRLDFSFELDFDPHRLIIGIPIWDENGFCITSYNSDLEEVSFGRKRGLVTGSISMNCYFNPGLYQPVFAILDGTEFLYRQKTAAFSVSNKERLFGFVTLPQNWSCES